MSRAVTADGVYSDGWRQELPQRREGRHVVADHARSQAHRRHVPVQHADRRSCVGGIFALAGAARAADARARTIMDRADSTTRCSRCTARSWCSCSSSRRSRRRSATSSCRSCSARRTSRSRGSTCSASTSTGSARSSLLSALVTSGVDTGWTFYTPYSANVSQTAVIAVDVRRVHPRLLARSSPA